MSVSKWQYQQAGSTFWWLLGRAAERSKALCCDLATATGLQIQAWNVRAKCFAAVNALGSWSNGLAHVVAVPKEFGIWISLWLAEQVASPCLDNLLTVQWLVCLSRHQCHYHKDQHQQGGNAGCHVSLHTGTHRHMQLGIWQLANVSKLARVDQVVTSLCVSAGSQCQHHAYVCLFG